MLGALIDPIQYQAVQVNVQIGRRAEALNEGDRAGVGFAPFQSGLLDQKCRDDPMNDLQHRVPDYDAAAWIGYAAPAGTPREALARISSEIQKALQSAELKERFLSLGLDPVSSTPEEMAAFMRREQERYGTIIRNANIKVEQ